MSILDWEPLFYIDVEACDYFITSANVTKPWHLHIEIYSFIQWCIYWMSILYQAPL